MPPRLAVFDFDGTLADSFPWFCAVLNDMASRHGFRPVATEEEKEKLRCLSTREILESLRVPMWKVPFIARDMRAMKRDADIRVFAGMDAALRHLARRGMGLAIVSSDSEANIRRTLGPDLSALFAHYNCDASLFGKTSKLRSTIAASGVAASEAIYVGDETRDAEAAHAVGLRFAAVAWGYAAKEALARKADLVFERVDEIARLTEL